VAGALWGWGVNRTRPVTTGDRCVVIVLTDTPSKWTRYLRSWERDRVEVAITTEWLGSCGAMGMIDDPVDYNDLLLFIVDLSGWKMIGDYDLSPDFPKAFPVAAILPGDGWDAEQQAAYSAARTAAVECGWTKGRRVWEHVDPRPGDLLAWAAGWWDGRKGVGE
jgi:hypothetical protein